MAGGRQRAAAHAREVLNALEGLPLDITEHTSTSGITALLTGAKPGPTILLRGDMDALPLHEDTGLEFTSRVEHQMHACGHDTHTAMLAGAARLLADRAGELAGRVLFMFQPGEEGHHGARFMLDEGLLDVPALANGTASPVESAFALHITSSLPSGWLTCRGGAAMASADTIHIEIIGKGGHASEPHRAVDPIPVACEIVQALQTMVTRTIDVFDPSVVTIARITAGTTDNIIPETASIEGTIRSVSEPTRTRARQRAARGRRHRRRPWRRGGSRSSAATPSRSTTTTSPRRRSAVATDIAGAERVVRLPHPIMGAEDFSYVLQRVPGSMMFLGGTPARPRPRHRTTEPFQPGGVRRAGDGHRNCHLRRLRVGTAHLTGRTLW